MEQMTQPYILIVEDSKTQARMLQFLLEEHNYTVRLAEHGQAALESLQSHPTLPWLVLSDVYMPEMNGFDLCKRVRANPEWRSIPLVLMTATQDSAEIVSVMECGADAFLTKPIQEERLLQTLALWNSAHPAFTPFSPNPDLETPVSFQVQAGDSLRPVRTTCRNLTNALTSYYRECAVLNRKSVDLEREAGEKRLWFDSLVNALPDPACVVTSQDEIRAMNPRFFSVLGLANTTVFVGRPSREVFPRNLLERIEELKNCVVETHQAAEDNQSLLLHSPQSWRLVLSALTDRTARVIGYLVQLRPSGVSERHTPGSLTGGGTRFHPSARGETCPTSSAGILNIEDGLNRLGGNEEIYRKVLKVFYTENIHTPEKVLAALNADDRETLHRLVHTVKGASGNIGAKDLYALASQTENVIRSGAYPIEESLHVFLESLRLLLDTLADVDKLSLK
jgi:CheY-like chemotaxis protein/HPt (histidine-containing phosphotransfer) domain-containing protein